MPEEKIEFLTYIMTAVSNCNLYSGEHPEITHLCKKALSVMDGLYSEDALSITILGSSLLINDVPVKEKNLQVNNLLTRLRRKGAEKIVIKKGITAEELMSFVLDIASRDKGIGYYPHIITGVLEVRVLSEGDNVLAIMNENIQKVKDIYQKASKLKELDMIGLEDVVISFISTVKKESDILRVLCPMKSYSEYTYTHITNVAVLSIFQAESLGIDRELLHDVGLAGLLHDVGKMYIPIEIIEKQGKLDGSEWQEMRKHPVYGALYLSSLPDVPKLAVIGALEHHMGFDGKGYPDTKGLSRRPHIISQIISIADFFDALRTERSYRKALHIPVILGLLWKGAGKEFNPALVENFVQALKRINAI